jgi:hypothetical protein
MTTLYEFAVGYTKLGVGTAPSSAPTITVVDSANNVLVTAATATTVLTNLVGAYRYSYSGADGLTCYALFHTTDTTMDQQDLFTVAVINPVVRDIQTRLPAALTANGNMKSSLLEILTTALTETSAGYLAAAFKKFLDVATPVFTAASVNLTASTKVDLVDAPNGTAVTAIQNGLSKPGTAQTITANQAVNVAQWGGANIVTPAVTGSPVVTLGGTQAAYAPSKAGDKMDIADVPSATGLAAVVKGIWDALTSGLITSGSIGKKLADWVVGTITANQAVNVAQWGGSNIATPAVTGEPVVTLGATQAAYGPAKAGDAMDLVDSLKNKSGSSGYSRTTDSLEALGEGGGGGTAPTVGEIDTQLTSTHGAGTWGAGGTGGALTLTYTLNDSGTGLPVEGATIELYPTNAYSGIISSAVTNALGQVTFSNLVAGTYYLKCIRAGYTTAYDSEAVA